MILLFLMEVISSLLEGECLLIGSIFEEKVIYFLKYVVLKVQKQYLGLQNRIITRQGKHTLELLVTDGYQNY